MNKIGYYATSLYSLKKWDKPKRESVPGPLTLEAFVHIFRMNISQNSILVDISLQGLAAP
jgi:hypothetical protein